MTQIIPPRIVSWLCAPSALTHMADRNFPRLSKLRPGDIFGIQLEIVKIADLTTSISGWLLRAGKDLTTWNDVDIVSMTDLEALRDVKREQLLTYGALRELDLGHLENYDPGWSPVSPDGIPARRLTIVNGAQMLTDQIHDAYYDTPQDVTDRNVLCLPQYDSAHLRIKRAADRRVAFALFTAFSQLDGCDDVSLSYAEPNMTPS